MAKDPKAAEGQVKVRVLVECDHGKCNDVTMIEVAQVDTLVGLVDVDPAAVAYAESLAK